MGIKSLKLVSEKERGTDWAQNGMHVSKNMLTRGTGWVKQGCIFFGGGYSIRLINCRKLKQVRIFIGLFCHWWQWDGRGFQITHLARGLAG